MHLVCELEVALWRYDWHLAGAILPGHAVTGITSGMGKRLGYFAAFLYNVQTHI